MAIHKIHSPHWVQTKFYDALTSHLPQPCFHMNKYKHNCLGELTLTNPLTQQCCMHRYCKYTNLVNGTVKENG